MTRPAPAPSIEFAACRLENMELATAIAKRMAAVLATGRVLQGPAVAEFEAELTQVCDRRHAVCVGSGTDALYFALLALGVGSEDEVLVPDLSFIATASAVMRTGARPVFVDVDDSCNLDLRQAESKLSKRTKALLYVQLFGGMGDPRALEAFGRAHGVTILEDGAQSFGAHFAGRPCGAVGQVSALSFDPMKVLSAPGSGGAVLTDDDQLAAHIRRLRYHGREGGEYRELGFNSQMPSTTATVLSLKLTHHERWTKRRRAIAARYIDALGGLAVTMPTWPAQVEHVWHKFILHCANRDALAAWLAARGVPTMVHYPRPFHRETLFGVRSDIAFPRACDHAATTLSLPIHAHLSDENVEYVIGAVTEFFRREL
jgi:dTDP-4-amino-4,6-dideoxygalactose transaminase